MKRTTIARKTPLKRTGKRKRMSKAEKLRRRRHRKLSRDQGNPQSRYWENKAKRAWRPAVAILCENRCVVCGQVASEMKLDAHHIFSKGRNLLKHNPMNGLLLCVDHHLYNKAISAHYGAPGLYAWLAEHEPERFTWIGMMRPKMDSPEWLKKHDYKADYELSRAIIDEQRDYHWLCSKLGLIWPEQRGGTWEMGNDQAIRD